MLLDARMRTRGTIMPQNKYIISGQNKLESEPVVEPVFTKNKCKACICQRLGVDSVPTRSMV
jgi:hypothetical protein